MSLHPTYFAFINPKFISHTNEETVEERFIQGVSIDSEVFTFERIVNPINKLALCCLSASNAFWIQKRNWIHDTKPCGMSINHRKDKHQTPLVLRLLNRQKVIRKKAGGRNRNNAVFLNTINTVEILAGELSNEKV